MAESGETSGPEDGSLADPGLQARRLLRAARSASLATVTAGQPFVSLVTPACTPDLGVLVFLSQLSEHTRHLQAEPRCAVMVQGPSAGANPQMTPRVTVTGRAEPCADQAMKARWLAIHPYAALYADFADFSLWRIRPAAGSLIGGFARAHRLGARTLLPPAGCVQAVADAEADILAHCNQDHAEAMDMLAQRGGGLAGSGWRMVTADCDGCDLAREDVVWRCAWPVPVTGGDDVRRALIFMLQQIRAKNS